jgi:hypothetical protein
VAWCGQSTRRAAAQCAEGCSHCAEQQQQQRRQQAAASAAALIDCYVSVVSREHPSPITHRLHRPRRCCSHVPRLSRVHFSHCWCPTHASPLLLSPRHASLRAACCLLWCSHCASRHHHYVWRLHDALLACRSRKSASIVVGGVVCVCVCVSQRTLCVSGDQGLRRAFVAPGHPCDGATVLTGGRPVRVPAVLLGRAAPSPCIKPTGCVERQLARVASLRGTTPHAPAPRNTTTAHTPGTSSSSSATAQRRVASACSAARRCEWRNHTDAAPPSPSAAASSSTPRSGTESRSTLAPSPAPPPLHQSQRLPQPPRQHLALQGW